MVPRNESFVVECVQGSCTPTDLGCGGGVVSLSACILVGLGGHLVATQPAGLGIHAGQSVNEWEVGFWAW